MAAKTTINYAELNQELDEILAQLQSTDVDIDESLKLYERGREIIEKMQAYLKTAENTVLKASQNKSKNIKANG